MKRFLIPLIVLAALLALLTAGLRHDPRRLPSALIGKPAPEFDLPRLHEPAQRLSTQHLRGQVWIMNVWASWCESCRDEHPLLVDLARQHIAPVLGLNYKDDRQNALQWLADAGDPYTSSIVDRTGQTAIDFGVYGVPETFVVDRAGVVRYREAGPLTRARIDGEILPLVRKLQSEGAP
ncbi:Thiol:disulfide interchange protein DsbE [Paraburkholderia caffeinitolerans]|uniref:Thiol:disulfide interchange protein DsbE n=1 Tax=Paraburkholderia caffeinitolerans TaxID=1723730 RepID=A0A6J5FJJ0_9BURK|nr:MULTISPECIES: DsbE family thiol:disulfide interchange protein [Paraburkholderia]CAB3778987.1 Thiol:disulfide interchange protein DsbE [Paraburkholderia caffeinitolerans]